MLFIRPCHIMSQQTLHIHLVSDLQAKLCIKWPVPALAQFTDVKPVEHVWTLVRTAAHLDALFVGIDRHPGILLMSIMDQELKSNIESVCRTKGMPAVSILDPVVNVLTSVLGQAMTNLPGGQRRLDTAYFDRMAAIDFAVSHDDGLNMGDLKEADMLIVGVSRTSKTPTSMYLHIVVTRLPTTHSCHKFHFHNIISID